MIGLDRTSNVPLHQQLYEILRARLESDEFIYGGKFLTDSELIQSYKISRNTARQVLGRLSKERFINRERGKGTIVAEPRLEQSLTKIISFTDEMHHRGLIPETIVISTAVVEPNQNQKESLKISSNTKLFCIKRLRLGDKIPICVEESYLVKNYFPNLLENDYSLQPLKRTIEAVLGSRLDYAHQKINAVAAPKDIAVLLEIPTNTPLLFIERITYSNGVPIEFLLKFYRGDRFILYNDLVG